ncbi:hypothetical protein VPH35_121737 [Triticum aestivum]
MRGDALPPTAPLAFSHPLPLPPLRRRRALRVGGLAARLPALLLIQGGGMNLSRVDENLLSSVCCARSLALLPPTPAPSRVEVPARAVVAATTGFDVTEVLKIT